MLRNVVKKILHLNSHAHTKNSPQHHSMTKPLGRCVMVNCGDRLPQHWPPCFDVLWVSLHVIYTENSLCPLLRSYFFFHTPQSAFLLNLIQHRLEGNSMEAFFPPQRSLWFYFSLPDLTSHGCSFVSHSCYFYLMMELYSAVSYIFHLWLFITQYIFIPQYVKILSCNYDCFSWLRICISQCEFLNLLATEFLWKDAYCNFTFHLCFSQLWFYTLKWLFLTVWFLLSNVTIF